jgi:hypothetical protein
LLPRGFSFKMLPVLGVERTTMKKPYRIVVFLLAATSLVGCVMVGTRYSPPTQEQLAASGYGAPLTIDYKKAIQTLLLEST